jgi:hypothetical protein
MTCKNCQTELEVKDNFCKNCGGKIIRNRLTIRNIFEQFSEHFLNYDNKFLQTFICLFTKPEDVIGGYIDGVRKKYVNVISYFAIALTISGLQLVILDKFFPEAMDMSALTVQGSGQDSNEMMSFIREYQSLLMMVNVPAYAFISYIVFYTLKKYNYTEHLVIFMYALSQLTIIGVLITVTSAISGLSIAHASLILMPVQFIYSLFCLQKLYKLSIKGMILRTLLFFLITLIIFVFFTIISIAIAYFDGSLMKQIEAQKAAKEKLGYLFLLHKLHLV